MTSSLEELVSSFVVSLRNFMISVLILEVLILIVSVLILIKPWWSEIIVRTIAKQITVTLWLVRVTTLIRLSRHDIDQLKACNIHASNNDSSGQIEAIGQPRPFKDGCHNSTIVRRSGTGGSPFPSVAISKSFKRVGSARDLLQIAEIRYENFKVAIHPDFSDQEITIGGTVSIKARTELCTLLKRNLDIFAWQPSDMIGVPRSIAEHRLNIREGYSHVRQKKRGQAPEHAKAIQVEVQKLVEAGIMREVYYHDWLSNPVMVKKHDGSWRMCVDFIDLNKACPQDCYPLPEIDWKVESLCGYPFKCFLDAYKGYHQIQMAEQDEEKTAFHTSHGVYCYTKNALRPQERWRNIPTTAEGMFLGYMINPEGIIPCPDKTEDVLQLSSPRTIKEVQGLNGKLASLNRFISKSAEKSLPLFKTLKKCIKKSDFHWTPYAKQAFKQLKQDLARLPMLRHNPDTGLFCEPSTADSLAKLYPNGKASPGASLRSLFQGASHRGHHRPAHQAGDVTSRRSRAIAKIERHARGAQYHIPTVDIYESVDSKLVENQVLGTYVSKEENMVKYLEKAKSLISGFTKFSISQVRKSKNKKADALSKIASTSFVHLSKQVLVEVLKEKSIQEDEVATVVEEEGPTWMTPIMEYLKDGTLLDDRKEASKLRIKASQYELWEGVLYRRSFLKPWLRCVGPLQADYVIREIHEGSCSMHAGPRSTVAKAMRSGYYLPTMHRDVRDMIRTRKFKFLIVAMDYFTKWIEAKAVATITGGQVKKFVWDNIVCHFDLPREIVSDNGQFSNNPFKYWCEKLNITQRFASVKHPQSNGLVERANRSFGEGIKACLGDRNKNWIKVLPHVLWAHRTMIKSSHGDTPFSLTYGTKDVIPAEIGMPTYRTVVVDAVHNNQEIQLNLDLLEEWRECAAIREAKAKLKMTKYYNTRVRGVTFRPGDFVYRSNEASHAMDEGNLSLKWEGPYEVTKALRDRAYRLRSMDGAVLP
nr:reverse transcriptase domain-containing protein [Tanacetum cinerariifolium]